MIYLLSTPLLEEREELEAVLAAFGSPVEGLFPLEQGQGFLLSIDVEDEVGTRKILGLLETLGKDASLSHFLMPFDSPLRRGYLSPEAEDWIIEQEEILSDGATIADFDSLLEMEGQKEALEKIVAGERLREVLRQNGTIFAKTPSNILLQGPSGVGKRNFALLACQGLSSLEGPVNYIDAPYLVSQQMPFGALDTLQEEMDKAEGGVLCIRRIDALLPEGGEERIDCLRSVVQRSLAIPSGVQIVATALDTGFFACFAKTNQDFKRAFPHAIKFPALDVSTLAEIFLQKARDAKICFPPQLGTCVKAYLEILKEQKGEGFAHGHEVDALFARMIDRVAVRLADKSLNPSGEGGGEEVLEFTLTDIPSFHTEKPLRRKATRPTAGQSGGVIHLFGLKK